MVELGTIEALFRYPVKSMRGERLDAATLGWHGLDGDRRFALRRLGVPGGFPWLSASSLPELVTFAPERPEGSEGPPTHVRTPDGALLPISGDALAAEIARRHGAPVEMMEMKHGVFDDGAVSLITSHTLAEVSRLATTPADVRRFRPNILVRSTRAVPFEEDAWVGGVLTIGDTAIAVTLRDVRCAMLNIDPDSGRTAPEMMKAAVRANENYAGVYGTVTRTGRLEVGQTIILHREQ
jgi:hypothetical protein